MDYKSIEAETIEWLKLARIQPQVLIAELKEMLGFYSGKNYQDPITNMCVQTNEVRAI